MKAFKVLAVLAVLAILMTACAAPAAAPAPAANAAAPAATAVPAPVANTSYGMDHQLHFIFVTHDLGAGVFAPVRRGMEDACKQINAICEFIGPQTFDAAQQVALLEAAIAKKPDGISTTRPDPAAYNDVLKKAKDAGITLTIFNTNDPKAAEALPAPFVGQDFTNYGKVWAREVMKDLPDGGDIAITDCCFGHYALEERNRSFQETLEKEGQGKWKVRDIINTTAEERRSTRRSIPTTAPTPISRASTASITTAGSSPNSSSKTNWKASSKPAAPIWRRATSMASRQATPPSASARTRTGRVTCRS